MTLSSVGQENSTQHSGILGDRVAAAVSVGGSEGASASAKSSVSAPVSVRVVGSVATCSSRPLQQQQQNNSMSVSSAFGTFSIPLHLQMPISTPVPTMMSQVGPYVPSTAGPKNQTPDIFRNKKLRSGKWIVEEERYADLLIEFFDKGLIMECDNGATLRSFLSRKLHCAPMRISKKYAGKGIGKKVFLTKMSVRNFQGITVNEIAIAETSLREAEANFYKAIFPDTVHPAHEQPCSGPPQFVCAPNTFPGLVPLVPAPIAGFPPFQPFALGNTAGAPLPANPLVSKSGSVVMPAPATSSQQAPVSNIVTNPSLRLQQSYLTALQQISEQPPNSTMQNQQQQLLATNNRYESSTTEQTKNTETTSTTTNSQHTTLTDLAPLPNQVSYLQPQAKDDPPPKIQEQPKSIPAIQNPPINNQDLHLKSCIENSKLSSGHLVASMSTELPDLLSGFDKVASSSAQQPAGTAMLRKEKETQRSSAMVGNGGNVHLVQLPHPPPGSDEMVVASRYSPTVTSRSFDDFHRFLGKDLSPLTGGSQLSSSNNKNQSPPSVPVHLSRKPIKATSASMKTQLLRDALLTTSSLLSIKNKELPKNVEEGTHSSLPSGIPEPYQAPSNCQKSTQALSSASSSCSSQPRSTNFQFGVITSLSSSTTSSPSAAPPPAAATAAAPAPAPPSSSAAATVPIPPAPVTVETFSDTTQQSADPQDKKQNLLSPGTIFNNARIKYDLDNDNKMHLGALSSLSSAMGTTQVGVVTSQQSCGFKSMTENNAEQQSPAVVTATNSNNPAWEKKPGIQVTADSYILLAQESSVAVSQHSAYMKSNSISSDHHGLCNFHQQQSGVGSMYSNVADTFKSVSLSLEGTVIEKKDNVKRPHDVDIINTYTNPAHHRKTVSPTSNSSCQHEGTIMMGRTQLSKKRTSATTVPMYTSQNVRIETGIETGIVSCSEPLSSDNASTRECTSESNLGSDEASNEADGNNTGFEPTTTESETTSNDSDSSYEKSCRKKARVSRRGTDTFVQRD